MNILETSFVVLNQTLKHGSRISSAVVNQEEMKDQLSGQWPLSAKLIQKVPSDTANIVLTPMQMAVLHILYRLTAQMKYIVLGSHLLMPLSLRLMSLVDN